MQSFMDENIVENWLRSLDLVHYTQAFIDNGYDDLEICKQVGDEDLDAIGVLAPDHRRTVLEAVDSLKKHGGTHVYFTLDPEYQRSQQQGSLSVNGGGGDTGDYASTSLIDVIPELGGDTQDMAEDGYVGARRSLVTYPKLQLTAIIQDKLAEDCINLGDYVPTQKFLCNGSRSGCSHKRLSQISHHSNHSNCSHSNCSCHHGNHSNRSSCHSISQCNHRHSHCDMNNEHHDNHHDFRISIEGGVEMVAMEALTPRESLCLESSYSEAELLARLQVLAERYGADLRTHPQDVFLRLLDLRDMIMAMQNGDDPTPDQFSGEPRTGPYSMFSVYGQSPRSVPPPLPACPPPSSNYEDPQDLDPTARSSPSHSSRSPLLPKLKSQSAESTSEINDIEYCEVKKDTSTLGRLFRKVGLKKTPRKYVYKQIEGDLNASEITMSDEERIDLMIQVKEGKLSMHDAVEMVKEYEREKKIDPIENGGHLDS